MCVYVVAACPIQCAYIVFVPIGLVLYTYTCNLCAVKGGSTEKPVTWELHMHEENTVYTTPCETMLSQFFKNLANIFFVLSASCSTCSEFHLLFLKPRCRCSVTVLKGVDRGGARGAIAPPVLSYWYEYNYKNCMNIITIVQFVRGNSL